MKHMDKLKEFFGKSGKAPDSGNSKEQRQRETELVEKMQNPPVASYTNPNAPMTYQEMALLVPRDMWLPKHPKHRAVFGLLQNMTRFLEESRIISKQAVDRYKNLPAEVPQQIRIRGIQEQMSAIRFRLDCSDYENVLEMEILKNRLYELYQVAKEVDPEGTTRYERHIDKQMRKARTRA